MVSPKTVLTNDCGPYSFVCSELCSVFYGGTPDNPDWSSAQRPGERRVVSGPGTFGYFRLNGHGGFDNRQGGASAVIVE